MPLPELTPAQLSFLSGTPVPVEPDRIERELSSLWKPAEDALGDPAPPLTRVCLGNFIWLGDIRQTPRMLRIVPQLVSRFPCRLFLVDVQTDSGALNQVQTTVNAHCFMPTPRSPQVCCEVIHFRVGVGAVAHIPGLVTPLLLPDVESTFWYFAPNSWWSSAVPRLEALADRVVTEVSAEADPATRLEELTRAERNVFSLSWFRFHRVRQQIATLFDDPSMRHLARRIESVTFEASGSESPGPLRVGVALTAGWLASRLNWEPSGPDGAAFLFRRPDGHVRVRLVPGTGEGEAHLAAVTIHCEGGEDFRLRLAHSAHTMELSVAGASSCPLPRVVDMAELDDAESLGLALAEQGTQRLFRVSAGLAVAMMRYLQRTTGAPPS